MAAKCSIPEIPLPHSGNPIPLLGLGTAAYPFRPGNVKEAALKAIELGYRHFDTAALYQTEQPLGEAIGEALKAGLIKSRDELFITSKLWICDAHKELVPALQASLRNLGLDYLDLYLIHWPMSSKPGNYELYMDKGEFMHIDFEAVWKEMEECQRLGLTKNIGVSNFSCKKLQFLLDVASIPPAVNQVELNPFWQQKKLKDFCKDKGIHITGYSPLGAHNCPWGSNPVLTCKVLEEIAKSRGKSVAQVCLRWAHEQGVSIVVKSFNLERMTENLGIFGWKLTDDDLLKIQQIPQKRGFSYAHLVDEVCGPYRSLAELWDGEEAS